MRELYLFRFSFFFFYIFTYLHIYIELYTDDVDKGIHQLYCNGAGGAPATPASSKAIATAIPT